jgi:hypothetical protein
VSYDDEDDAETVPCPSCGEEIYEEAERCPHCERYISREDAPGRRPLWMVLGALLALAAALGWVLSGR